MRLWWWLHLLRWRLLTGYFSGVEDVGDPRPIHVLRNFSFRKSPMDMALCVGTPSCCSQTLFLVCSLSNSRTNQLLSICKYELLIHRAIKEQWLDEVAAIQFRPHHNVRRIVPDFLHISGVFLDPEEDVVRTVTICSTFIYGKYRLVMVLWRCQALLGSTGLLGCGDFMVPPCTSRNTVIWN